jgi:YVTN family beta-propeller protein
MLFTDIEGSTRLLRGAGSDAYRDILLAHRRVLRSAFADHGGREIDTEGDSFFVVFRRASDAVAAAVQAQCALQEQPWPEGLAPRVRMGMHTGEPSLNEEGYHGLGVHRAARISALGHGGQILLSGATRAVLADELDAALQLRDLGDHRIKDFAEPERIFEVRHPGAPDESPPLKSLAAQPANPPFARRFVRARPRRGLVVALTAAAVLAAAAFAVLLLGDDGATPARAGPDTVAVLSADGRKLDAAIPVGAAPGGIAVGEDGIWVANTEDGTVTRIDPGTRAVVQRIQVGNGPAGIAVGGGFVWVADSLDGTVSRIDPRLQGGRRQQTIPVGNQPTGVAFGHGAVWVANVADKTLSRIDPATGRAHNGIEAGSGVDALAVGPSGVWVASRATDTVTQIDPRTFRRLQTVGVGQGPSALAVTSGAAWVASELTGTLSRLDPEQGIVREATPIGASPTGVAAGGGVVWVSDASGRLTRVDARSGDADRPLRLGGRLGDVAVSGDALYVAVRDSGRSHRGGTLELVGGDVVQSVDPAVAYAPAAWRLQSVIGDGLVGYRRVGGTAGADLVPDLARSLPALSDGGRTLSFRMRRGVRYSSGVPVRASDIRRGIERSFDIKGSPGPDFYGSIAGAAACKGRPGPCDLSEGLVSDDRAGTLTIHLTRRDPDLPYRLALSQAFAVPPGTPRTEAKDGLPATGPYRVARAHFGEEVLLVRNPRFREWSSAAQPAGVPDRIRLRLGLSPEAQVAAIEGAHADLTADTYNFTDAYWGRLAVASGSRMRVSPASIVSYVFLDTRVPPFDDVRVRRAVNLAVDRSFVDGSIIARRTCQLLPPNSTGYRPYCPWGDRPDLARARRLVAQTGTRALRVHLWTPRESGAADLVRAVADALRQLGYRPSVRAFRSYSAYFEAINAGSRPQAGWWPWIADYPAPSTFFDPVVRCGGGVNFGGFCRPGIDRLADRAGALQATDPQAAADLWAKVDRRVTDAAPLVWLTSVNDVNFTSERLRNYQRNPQVGPLIGQLWVR